MARHFRQVAGVLILALSPVTIHPSYSLPLPMMIRACPISFLLVALWMLAIGMHGANSAFAEAHHGIFPHRIIFNSNEPDAANAPMLAGLGGIAPAPPVQERRSGGTATAQKPTKRKKGATGKAQKRKKTVKGKGATGKRKNYGPKRKRRSTATAAAPAAPKLRSVAADSIVVEQLADGITYQWMRTSGGHIAHVVKAALGANARLRTIKAHQRFDGLQKVADIFEMADSLLEDTVIAATNASFWKATYNSPIGPTITNGEVIETLGYKAWSSLLIYEDGTIGFDRVRLTGQLLWKYRQSPIAAVNARGGEDGLILYNRYYGDSIPRGSRRTDSAIIAEVLANQVAPESGDETEVPLIDTAGIVAAWRAAKLREDREHPMLKIALEPLKPRRKRDPLPHPSVGDTMRLHVVAVDTGSVEIPENGFVVSLGLAAEYFTAIQEGDTVKLIFQISPTPQKNVRDLLTGTPRLVRDGVADPEYETEGSKAVRFVQGSLARTAVGATRDGDTLILVAINSGSKEAGTVGMNLSELARFMVEQGAHQAMNFDGGGSTSMVIDGETVSRQGSKPSSRRVSNALVIVKTKSPQAPKKKGRALQPTGE